MRTVLFLLALLWPLSALAAEPVPLSLGSGDRHSLAPHFTYLEDPAGRLTPDDLLRPLSNVLFRPATGKEINFGYSRSVFWLKAALKRDSREAEKLFLEIAYPTLDKVTVFLASPDGGRQVAESGDLRPFASRPYRHHDLIFPLTFAPAGQSTLLIRVQSEGSLTVPATLWREPAFYRHSLDEYAVLSLYFGILGALFLYNLLLFLSLREGVYLAYICFVASMAVGQLSQSGLGNEYLWPNFPAWGNIAFPAGFAATGFFGALFTRLFLDTRRSVPRLDRVITALAAGFAFAAVSPAVIPYRATAIITSLLGVTFSAVAVAAGVICLLRGNRGARFFLLAWSMLLAGVAMLGMRNLAWLPTTFLTSYGMQIGSALEMLLLSFALADRIHHMRREKDAAQQKALQLHMDMEQESVRVQKLDSLAALAGGIAHDFNNMLTIIMSTTTLAKMRAKDDAAVVAKIEEVEREILRARELTGQLLTFAKGGAPVRRLSPLPDLLRDTVAFSLTGSNVGCGHRIAEDLWSAEIDRTQIRQVISNLVLNAVQAMPGGGTLRVRADNTVVDGGVGLPLSPGRYARIAFEDSGSGIAPEHLPKIFDPFFTTKAGGSGLGLSTCYSIIKKHDGYIDVQSRPGAGSVFTVYLPASEEVWVEEGPLPVAEKQNGGGKVLLMDDDEKLLKTVGEMLAKLGYEVETARNGEEALILYRRSLAHAKPFHAVLLDVTVAGGMGGKDCVAELLRLDPGAKAIVISGYSADSVLAEYGRYGFRGALAKPFTVGELQERLASVMAGEGGLNA